MSEGLTGLTGGGAVVRMVMRVVAMLAVLVVVTVVVVRMIVVVIVGLQELGIDVELADRLEHDGLQFVQNWDSPKVANKCYRITMTAKDGSSISAFFKAK